MQTSLVVKVAFAACPLLARKLSPLAGCLSSAHSILMPPELIMGCGFVSVSSISNFGVGEDGFMSLNPGILQFSSPPLGCQADLFQGSSLDPYMYISAWVLPLPVMDTQPRVLTLGVCHPHVPISTCSSNYSFQLAVWHLPQT